MERVEISSNVSCSNFFVNCNSVCLTCRISHASSGMFSIQLFRFSPQILFTSRELLTSCEYFKGHISFIEDPIVRRKFRKWLFDELRIEIKFAYLLYYKLFKEDNLKLHF